MLQEQPDGSTAAVPDLLETMEISEDAKTFTFTIKQGVMFAPPVSREVTAQDFVDSWNYMPTPRTSRRSPATSSQPLEGLRPRHRLRVRGHGLSGVKAHRRLHLRGRRCSTPFARVPADAGATPSPSDPRRLRQGGRPQGVRRQAGRHRPVHGRLVEAQPVHHAGQEPRLLERRRRVGELGHRRLRRRHQHADLRRREHRVARLPEGRPRLRHHPVRQLHRRRRTTPRSRTARGRPRRIRPRASTSSASR